MNRRIKCKQAKRRWLKSGSLRDLVEWERYRKSKHKDNMREVVGFINYVEGKVLFRGVGI